MTRPLVKLHNVRRTIGKFELHIPEWTVEPGTVVGLVGPNGAGKTTLLRLLAGVDQAHSGEVSVLGMDPAVDFNRIRIQCAYMTDNQPLFNVRISRLIHLLSAYYPTWDADHVDLLLKRFELDPNQQVEKLSKGQGTRLRLILAMAFHPTLLLLDEPGVGLDLSGRRSLLESVVDIAGQGKQSVIISSHHLEDVERISDRLLVLDGGTIQMEGQTDELIQDGCSLEELLLEVGAA